MYKLERLQPEIAQGLPLYRIRVTPRRSSITDVIDIRRWCKERNITVHTPSHSLQC